MPREGERVIFENMKVGSKLGVEIGVRYPDRPAADGVLRIVR